MRAAFQAVVFFDGPQDVLLEGLNYRAINLAVRDVQFFYWVVPRFLLNDKLTRHKFLEFGVFFLKFCIVFAGLGFNFFSLKVFFVNTLLLFNLSVQEIILPSKRT